MPQPQYTRTKGFTLIEILVALAVLSLLVLLLGSVFDVIYKTYRERTTSAGSSMEALMALELMRRDIELAGFGLPWGTNGTLGINYREVADTSLPCIDAPEGEPRGVCVSDNTGPNGSDRLVLKLSLNWLNSGARKTGFLKLSENGSWVLETSGESFSSEDFFIVLNPENRRLVRLEGDWLYSLSDVKNLDVFSDFEGNKAPELIYPVFGLLSTEKSKEDLNYRKPFNRIDYFLDTPSSKPKRCASGTYTLYRAVASFSDGKFHSKEPILDCVLDLQAALFVKSNGSFSWLADTGNLTAKEIREKVRGVLVFVVYQMGVKNKEAFYTENSSLDLKTSDGTLIKSLKLSGDLIHYRWKTLKIFVPLSNLMWRKR